MAVKNVEFIVSEKGTAKTKAGLKGVDFQLVSMAKSAIGVGAAMMALRKASELTKLASDAINVERAFRNLSKEPDKMLQAMKKAVGGTIAEFELMKQFNQAALLGLPLDRFDEMISIARGAAVATGQSMDFMLNSIVTGIGRQSKLMIDNLGILVSVEAANEKYAKSLGRTAASLTDVERKTAFANAVLDAGAKNLANMGGAAKGSFDGVNRLGATLADMGISVGGVVVPAVDGFADALADVLTGMNELQRFKDGGVVFSTKRQQEIDDYRKSVSSLGLTELTNLKEKLSSLPIGLSVITEDSISQVDQYNIVVEELNNLLGSMAPGLIRNRDGIVNLGAGYDSTRQIIKGYIEDAKELMKIQHKQIALLPEITLASNDLTTAWDSQAAASAEAGLKGLVMAQDLGDASRALAKQYIVEGVFGLVKNIMATSPPWIALPLALAGGLAANALFDKVMPAATGADFTTTKPQLMLVGEAGREHVSVTPLEGPNINGPQGGNTFIFNGDIIGTQDFVEANLIPAINLATRQGRASIA